VKLTHIQNTTRDDYEKPADLDSDDIGDIEKVGATVGAYWYRRAPYEGSGYAVFLVGERWHLHDLGHCSCYGPMEHLELKEGFATLDDLLASCSIELRGEIDPLVELMKYNP